MNLFFFFYLLPLSFAISLSLHREKRVMTEWTLDEKEKKKSGGLLLLLLCMAPRIKSLD